jgi:phosphoadenosine phosphosulfate reductase
MHSEWARLENAPAPEILSWAIATYGERFAISTSFQSEGMVLIDMASRISAGVRVLTLDTGRLPEETYAMIETVRARYGITVETVAPERGELEAMIKQHGPNLFYGSVPQRTLCCQIRKVRPLANKLKELRAYAVGLRRDQTQARGAQPKLMDGEPVKLSPLADWSAEQVSAYTREHDVPRHPLYAQGYRSIGCAPCTRATAAGEDERAGRWWWEDGTQKECGLHYSPEGKAERTIDVLLRQVLEAVHA